MIWVGMDNVLEGQFHHLFLEEPIRPHSHSGHYQHANTNIQNAEWLFYRAEGTEEEGSKAECIDWVVISQLVLRVKKVLLFVMSGGGDGVNCDGCGLSENAHWGTRSGEEED
jgi:hypothetical protein